LSAGVAAAAPATNSAYTYTVIADTADGGAASQIEWRVPELRAAVAHPGDGHRDRAGGTKVRRAGRSTKARGAFACSSKPGSQCRAPPTRRQFSSGPAVALKTRGRGVVLPLDRIVNRHHPGQP